MRGARKSDGGRAETIPNRMEEIAMGFSKLSMLAASALIMTGLTACEGESGTQGMVQAFGPGTPAKIGEGCGGTDKICLGVSYVVYKDSSGKPVASPELAAANIKATNAIYAQCGIAFQIDEYQAVDPATYGLAYGAQAANQLTQIRETFGNPSSLLVAFTGPWGTTKNAWTSMPGSAPYGAIHESGVADYPNILAHELGHYLGLDHEGDTTNLLSTIIYPNSTGLSESQCNTMRATADQFWGAMKR